MFRFAIALSLLLTACSSDDGPRTKEFGGDRPAILHTPDTLTDGKKYPLVMLLHGYSASGLIQSAYFHMETLTDGDRAFYIAPDGLVDSMGHEFWNADPACCDFDGRNPDDVAYLGGILDDVIAEWPVDRNAVYVIGHSNGGYMSYRMACERADVIAAIGSLAGDAASMAAACTPTRPVSVLHMHGTADTAVPYDGGMGGVFGVGAVGSVEQWAGHDGCTTTRTPTVTLDLDTSVAGSETHGETMSGCPSKVGVDLWTLEGSTHLPVLTTSFAGTVLDWLVEHKR